MSIATGSETTSVQARDRSSHQKLRPSALSARRRRIILSLTFYARTCESYLESCIRLFNPNIVLAHSGTAFIDEYGAPFPFDHETEAYIDPRTGSRYRADSPEVGDHANPVVRFWQVLTGACWGTHCFGVIRREALLKTRLLPNLAGSDRARLAELALLGRFKSSPEPRFLRRLCPNGSWTLGREELKGYLCTDGEVYSRRTRQLEAYFSTPRGKPIGTLNKLVCTGMVAVRARMNERSAWRQPGASSSEVVK
jgi:hypothetical protein